MRRSGGIGLVPRGLTALSKNKTPGKRKRLKRLTPQRLPAQPPKAAPVSKAPGDPTPGHSRPRRPATPNEIERILATRKRVMTAFVSRVADAPLDQISGALQRTSDSLSADDRLQLGWLRENYPHRKTFIGEHARIWREYRRDFALYGGDRPFLSREAFEAADQNLAMLRIPEMLATVGIDIEALPRVGQRRMKALQAAYSDEERLRLEDQLLKDVWFVSDILPVSPPPRPRDWPEIDVGAFGEDVSNLLEVGADFRPMKEGPGSASASPPRPGTIGSLVSMATDERMLRGWPADAAAWAPYHAMTLLGVLGEHATAPLLLRAIDVVGKDDWISDHLVGVCLALMGPPVEPLLWDLALDRRRDTEQRGLALEALTRIAGDHADRRDDIAGRMAEVMSKAPYLDRGRKTVNAYAAWLLHNEPFGDARARAAIQEADAAGRLDHTIHNPSDNDAL